MNVYKHKQIEDIIDARKRSGQYDILCNRLKFIGQNTRYAYSTPACHIDEIRDDFNIGDDNNNERIRDLNSIGPTDSEITLVRVKREGSQFRTYVNLDNHDKAIPGDGAHLGESPSLVNLATLVIPSSKCDNKSSKMLNEQEYLVPLSSWEPDDTQDTLQSTSEEREDSNKSVEVDSNKSNVIKEKSTTSLKNLLRCIVFWRK